MQYEYIKENGVWKLYWGGYFGQETEDAPVVELVLEEEQDLATLTPAGLTVEDEVFVPTLSA
jgi:hypothetical protein